MTLSWSKGTGKSGPRTATIIGDAAQQYVKLVETCQEWEMTSTEAEDVGLDVVFSSDQDAETCRRQLDLRQAAGASLLGPGLPFVEDAAESRAGRPSPLPSGQPGAEPTLEVHQDDAA